MSIYLFETHIHTQTQTHIYMLHTYIYIYICIDIYIYTYIIHYIYICIHASSYIYIYRYILYVSMIKLLSVSINMEWWSLITHSFQRGRKHQPVQYWKHSWARCVILNDHSSDCFSMSGFPKMGVTPNRSFQLGCPLQTISGVPIYGPPPSAG